MRTPVPLPSTRGNSFSPIFRTAVSSGRRSNRELFYPLLVHLNWRAFGIFWAALPGPFFAKNGYAQVPDFAVDFPKGGFREFVRWHQFFLEAPDAGERAID